MRHRIDCKIDQLFPNGCGIIFRENALALQPRNERVDQCLALLCRHVGLDGEGATLTVNDIVAGIPVQTGGQHVIEALRDGNLANASALELGECLDASDGLPEGRGLRAAILQTIEQDVLDFLNRQEGFAILR
jgi:hypothetical protein